MPTLRDRLASPDLRDQLRELLVENYGGHVNDTADRVLTLLERELLAGTPRRLFTPAHLGIVYLLAEQQGATHVRLRRLWDAKAARPGPDAWPWISDSGIRTRTSELVAWGIVEDTGARGESATGRPATIWTLVGIDPRSVGRDVADVPGITPDVPDTLDRLLAQAGSDVLIRSQLELAASVAGVGRHAAAQHDGSQS